MTRGTATLTLFLFSVIYHVAESTETLASYFLEIDDDLTKVTWEHAVNSREKLDAALKGDALMLEADVVLGYTSQEDKDQRKQPIPIMAHPPLTISDLTLKEFLETFEKSEANKGIKLDFKTRDAFAFSESVIDSLFNSFQRDYPVWLNADIVPGPVNGSKNVVDADYFLTTCVTRYPSATISVGWSTSLEPGSTEGRYRQEDIDRMTDALNRNMVLMSPVTFAVRAAFAARSVDILTNLIKSSTADSTTLTIWSSVDTDVVDIDGLEQLIKNVGKDKVYLDLPKEMMKNVISKESPSAAPSITLPSISLIAIISLGLFLFL